MKNKTLIIVVLITAVAAIGIFVYLKNSSVSADVEEARKISISNNMIEVQTSLSQEELDRMSAESKSSTINPLVESKVASAKATKKKSIEPGSFQDYIVVAKTKDGQNYRSKNLAKAGATVESNFRFGAEITDETKQLVYAAYPKVIGIYGPRDSTNVIGVEISSYTAYSPYSETILLAKSQLTQQDVIAHEMMHAFHSEHIIYTPTSGLWEEGMATAGTLAIYPNSGLMRYHTQVGFYKAETQNFPYESYFDMYQSGAPFFYRLYIENPNIFKQFNGNLYKTNIDNNRGTSTDVALITVLKKTAPTLESKIIEDWISKNNAFYSKFSSTDGLYSLSMVNESVLDNSSALSVATDPGDNSIYRVVVKDLNGKVLKSASQSITTNLYKNYIGLVRVEIAPSTKPSAIHSAYLVKVNGEDPGYSTYGASLNGGDIAVIKDLSTNKLEYSAISNGMFKFTDVMNKDGKFKISVHSKTSTCNMSKINSSCLGTLISTKDFDRIKTYKTLALSTGPYSLSDKYFVLVGSPSKCIYTIVQDTANKSFININSAQKCGKTLFIDGVSIIRFWGVSKTYKINNLGTRSNAYRAFSAFSNEPNGQALRGVLSPAPVPSPTISIENPAIPE